MFLSRVMALPMACLILLLSLSSVSQHLHELIFHGDEGCRHSFGHHSCGAHDKHEGQEEKGEEEKEPEKEESQGDKNVSAVGKGAKGGGKVK